MSVVSLLGVNILNNPAKFTDNYELEITFECLEQLEKGASLEAIPFGLPPLGDSSKMLTLVDAYRSRMEADLCWLRYFVSHNLLL